MAMNKTDTYRLRQFSQEIGILRRLEVDAEESRVVAVVEEGAASMFFV